MQVNGKLVEKVSEKSGKSYVCIEIHLTPNYVKTVFLDKAELELLKLVNTK